MSLADSLFVVAFATVLFPAFSAMGGADSRPQLRQATATSLGVVLVVIAPIVALLTVASTPIVTLLFGRGAFDSRAVAMTSLAVSAYAVALLGIAVRSVLTRTSLAVGDSRSLVTTAACAMVVNVVGDLTLGLRLGIVGLAASTSASVLFAAIMLTVLLARRHQAIDLANLRRTLPALGLSLAIAGVACWTALRAWISFGPAIGQGWLSAVATTAVAAVACLLAYVIAITLLRIPAAQHVKETLLTLLRRSARP